MINQGFVTDSDTEKELKKWQQARTTAVDEDKLKQQYKKYKVKFDGAVHFLMHTEELKGAYENAERKR